MRPRGFYVRFDLGTAQINAVVERAADPAQAYDLALQSLDPKLAELAREVPRERVTITGKRGVA